MTPGINLSFDLNLLTPFLPFLIPLALIELGLLLAALIHIFTHKHYRVGTRLIWVLVCILVTTVGPILYFCIGRGENEREEREQ